MAPGASVDTGIVAVVDGEVIGGVSGRTVDFTIERGDVVDLVVANVFTAASGGGGGGSGEGGAGGSGGSLPNTGASDTVVAAQAGLLAVLVGLFVIALARTSRRWSW